MNSFFILNGRSFPDVKKIFWGVLCIVSSIPNSTHTVCLLALLCDDVVSFALPAQDLAVNLSCLHNFIVGLNIKVCEFACLLLASALY